MESRFYEVFDKYCDQFGDSFPTMEHQSASTDELISMMEQCIAEDKNAAELFGVIYDGGIKY